MLGKRKWQVTVPGSQTPERIGSAVLSGLVHPARPGSLRNDPGAWSPGSGGACGHQASWDKENTWLCRVGWVLGWPCSQSCIL